MDTKLKKSSYYTTKKCIAFFIVIVCFALATSMFVSLIRNTKGLEPLLEPSYVNTSELFNYQQNFYIGLNNLLKLKNEEYIQQGNTIDKIEFENRKKDIFFEWYNQIDNQMNQSQNEYIDGRIDVYNLLKEKFETENLDRINEIYKSMIDDQLRSYYSLLQRVNSKEGLYYYATNGEKTYTNTDQIEPGYYSGFKAYWTFDKDGIKVKPTMKDNINLSFTFESTHYTVDNKIYIAATDEYIAKKQAEWDKHRLYLENGITIILSAISLLFIALLYLVWEAGRKEDNKNVHLMAIDRLYTDVNITIILGVIITWIAIHMVVIKNRFLNYIITDFTNIQPDFWGVILFNIICSSIVLTLFLSLIRHFKNKTIISHSILGIVFKKLRNVAIIVFAKLRTTIKEIFNSGPLSVRIAAVILISEIAIFLMSGLIFSVHSAFALFWLIVLCALSLGGIYYVILRIKPFAEIVKGVQEIKNGRLEYVIDVKGDNEFAKLASNINEIADGLKNAVAKEIKADRMKSELITNVSHDLKTPLTSIINYVDLLSKEKLIPDVANDYVAVVKQKSEKLKLLTQDLFEISKAQTGNISIEVEKIDISILLRQSLAEYDEQISLSGLDFKINIQDANTFIMADGKRLSRVFENLIGNVLKYSLVGTRVYIDVFVNESSVFIEFKNIANYEMNFREDEILERFVRGDKSRSTEGNGIGLAIAESYVTACGGSLQISVDGDLFKASIRFAKA